MPGPRPRRRLAQKEVIPSKEGNRKGNVISEKHDGPRSDLEDFIIFRLSFGRIESDPAKSCECDRSFTLGSERGSP